jgi:hypothetical protein
MFMRENSREENAMEEAPSGGQMAAGTKGISEMESSPAGESSTERVDIASTRATGTTGCSTARAPSTSKTENDTKALSRKTNSMVRESSTRTTQSFTESGRTMSFQWSTW